MIMFPVPYAQPKTCQAVVTVLFQTRHTVIMEITRMVRRKNKERRKETLMLLCETHSIINAFEFVPIR